MQGMAAKTFQLFTCDSRGVGVNMFIHLSVWVYTTGSLTPMQLIRVYVLCRHRLRLMCDSQLIQFTVKAKGQISYKSTPNATKNIRRKGSDDAIMHPAFQEDLCHGHSCCWSTWSLGLMCKTRFIVSVTQFPRHDLMLKQIQKPVSYHCASWSYFFDYKKFLERHVAIDCFKKFYSLNTAS